jgi:hypothetical protein
VKVPAETLGWRLTLGSEGLSRLQNSHKPAPSGFAEGWVMYPPYPMGVPHLLLPLPAYLTHREAAHDVRYTLLTARRYS